MDINGEYIIPSNRSAVWAALNDPEALQACIPGCEELKRTESDEGFEARVVAKIGPVKATFRGSVRLEDIVPEQSYSIVGEGKGGAAGFAKLKANVKLEDADNGATRLTYTADAQLGGKLAQLGSRLIEGTARKYADDFFTSLTARLTPATGTLEAAASAAAPAATAALTAGGSSRLMLYALGAAAAAVLIIAFL